MPSPRRERGESPQQQTAPSRGSTAPARGPATGGGWGAAEGGVKATIEREKQEAERRSSQGFMPLRFWQKQGEEVEVVILDNSFTDASKGCGFVVFEHNLQDSAGKWGNFESCPSEFAHCACCEMYPDHKPYRLMLLTVGVLKEWTSKKTGETHHYSKMLLPIKMGQVEQFQRLEEIAIRKHGTTRGMCLWLKRGTGQTTYSIGEPVPNDDGEAFEMWGEEDIMAEFGHAEVKGRDGKALRPANEDTRVFNYAQLFPKPDAADIRRRYGGGAVPGSRQQVDGGNPGYGDGAASDARPARGRRHAAPPEESGAESVEATPSGGRGRTRRNASAPDPFDADGDDGDDIPH